jgi:hypothetical protein
MKKKLSLAQLRRDATSGRMSVEMKVRCGEPVDDSTPARLLGKRKVVGANTVALKIEIPNGRTSELRLGRASLVEYDGETLETFYPGYRKMTDVEARVMSEWKAIEETPEYRERLKYDLLTDGSGTFWKKRSFFQTRGMDHLLGYEEKRGLKLDSNRMAKGIAECVRDASVKGELMMRYAVSFD